MMFSSLTAAEATELLEAEFLSYFRASTEIKEQQQTMTQEYDETFSVPGGDDDIFSLLNFPSDDEEPLILPQSLNTYGSPEGATTSSVNTRGLSKDFVTSPLDPYGLSFNDLTNQFMKAESDENKSLRSGVQDSFCPGRIDDTAIKRSFPPSSSSLGINNTGVTLKEAARPSKTAKKIRKRQKKFKRALRLANLGLATDEVRPEFQPEAIISSNALPIVADDSVPPSTPAIEDQKVTTIQSMCKVATGEDLSASEALIVKEVGDGTLFREFAEFSKTVGGSLQMNEQMLCSFYIPTHPCTSSQAACGEYLKVLRPSRDCKWKPNTSAEEIHQRIIQVLLHLSCEKLVMEIEEKEASGLLVIPNRRKRNNRTIAHDWILEAAYGDRNTKELRKQILEECRWGDRWRRPASRVGLGILLLASKFLAKYIGANTQFKVGMIDALALYVQDTYPKLVVLFQSLTPITEEIMLGREFSLCEITEILGAHN